MVSPLETHSAKAPCFCSSCREQAEQLVAERRDETWTPGPAQGPGTVENPNSPERLIKMMHLGRVTLYNSLRFKLTSLKTARQERRVAEHHPFWFSGALANLTTPVHPPPPHSPGLPKPSARGQGCSCHPSWSLVGCMKHPTVPPAPQLQWSSLLRMSPSGSLSCVSLKYSSLQPPIPCLSPFSLQLIWLFSTAQIFAVTSSSPLPHSCGELCKRLSAPQSQTSCSALCLSFLQLQAPGIPSLVLLSEINESLDSITVW